MATPITVGERIVLHLAQFSKNQNDFDAPFEVSQDGIGEALRISRAHAAIELKKLREAGTVTERISHIKAGAVKRKVYFLTPAGEERSKALKDFASRQGIEIMPLLDLKRCKGEDLWDQLNPELRSLLAKASVFRRPFKRAALPQANINLLPEDKEGMVDLPESLRSSIPPLLDPAVLREAHSFAADYWLEEGDYIERLHHLIWSNRTMEGQMLLANRGLQMVKGAGPELLESLRSMPPSPPRLARAVREVRGEAALRFGDTEFGRKVAEEMMMSGDQDEAISALALKGRLLMSEGSYDMALLNLSEVHKHNPTPLLDCDIAMCLGALGRKEEALRTIGAINRNGPLPDPDRLEELYVGKGRVLASLGRNEEALANYSKALGLARPGDKRDIFRAMAGCYEALGMTEKARELSRKASIRK